MEQVGPLVWDNGESNPSPLNLLPGLDLLVWNGAEGYKTLNRHATSPTIQEQEGGSAHRFGETWQLCFVFLRFRVFITDRSARLVVFL